MGAQRLSKARLIIAAPELLAALKGMLTEFDQCARNGSQPGRTAAEAVSQARAAIAKATGEAG